MTNIFSSSSICVHFYWLCFIISFCLIWNTHLLYISQWTNCCDMFIEASWFFTMLPCIIFTMVMIHFHVITYFPCATTLLVWQCSWFFPIYFDVVQYICLALMLHDYTSLIPSNTSNILYITHTVKYKYMIYFFYVYSSFANGTWFVHSFTITYIASDLYFSCCTTHNIFSLLYLP